MNKNGLLAAWSGMFVICAGLGFVPAPTGFLKFLCMALALLFFVPGAMLLWQGKQSGSKTVIRLVRNLSALSLGLTVLFLLANVLSVFAPEFLGSMLHVMLGILSVPMFCSRAWGVSLFFWACLLFSAIHFLGKKKS